MKHLLLVFLLTITGSAALYAADGYKIKVRFTDAKDQKVALAHYYGKPLPTIYKVDSAVLDKNGVAVLETDQKIIGGLYIFIVQGTQQYFEFLLDNGQSLDITATASKLPTGVTFKKSKENERFFEYVNFLNEVGEKHAKYTEELKKATTHEDTAALQDKFNALSTQVTAFREDYIKKYPNSLLANIFKALEMPKFPGSDKPFAQRDEDWYRLYREHYWDNVDFSDERLVYTPLMDGKLNEYFSKMVQPIPDSFDLQADNVVKKARASKEMFKYVVHWITNYAQESDIMGMDAVFVHMVENYYMRGDAFWLNPGTLQKYIDRAKSIAPNVIGNVAPEMKMTKRDGTGQISLSDIDAKYLLLVFWSPDCGHCREEIPRIDSVIRAEGLMKKGLKVVGFNIDKETDKWNNVIKANNLNDWIHVYDPERTSNFRAEYDVYGTPSIYMLDERKIIQGKKLDHSNMLTIIKILEEEATSKK